MIAAFNDELTVNRLFRIAGKSQALAESTQYKPIEIAKEEVTSARGGVSHVLRKVL